MFSDGSVFLSDVWPWLFNEVPGLPGIVLGEGRVTIAIDTAGNVTVGGGGRFVDLCAALAA